MLCALCSFFESMSCILTSLELIAEDENFDLEKCANENAAFVSPFF